MFEQPIYINLTFDLILY